MLAISISVYSINSNMKPFWSQQGWAGLGEVFGCPQTKCGQRGGRDLLHLSHGDRKENAQDHSVKPTEAPQRGSKDEFIFPAEHGTPVAEGRPRALEQVLRHFQLFSQP